jgi:hypothetical protein
MTPAELKAKAESRIARAYQNIITFATAELNGTGVESPLSTAGIIDFQVNIIRRHEGIIQACVELERGEGAAEPENNSDEFWLDPKHSFWPERKGEKE